MSDNPTGEVEKILHKEKTLRPKNVGDYILKQILDAEDERARREKAIKILNQAVKYIDGYLSDYDILIERDYRKRDYVKVCVTVYLHPSEESDITDKLSTD